MRRLIYVPIIHTSADLGSIAEDVTKRGIADLGEDIWKRHERAVEGFWDVISNYFDSIDVSGMNPALPKENRIDYPRKGGVKIYQDGMVADGEVGQKIVEEGIKSGSKNYELISRLLKRGAFLVKTEDLKLVKKERDRLLKITQAKSIARKIMAFIKYRLVKGRLLDKRDKFIAKRIDETLNQGETGIIFIGAFHNIKTKLPKDIQISEIKDADKVREYHRLLPFYNRNKGRFEELSRYLVSEINRP
ncbi:MAG: hypothetical protein HY878_05460 [Deltaproteobacteria bacterium]|nr:hypothetical protein [Deltaproteobacteria bacterium]